MKEGEVITAAALLIEKKNLTDLADGLSNPTYDFIRAVKEPTFPHLTGITKEAINKAVLQVLVAREKAVDQELVALGVLLDEK